MSASTARIRAVEAALSGVSHRPSGYLSLSHPKCLPRQQLPVAALFLPDLQDPDLGRARFSFAFEFDRLAMAHDRVITDDRGAVKWTPFVRQPEPRLKV